MRCCTKLSFLFGLYLDFLPVNVRDGRIKHVFYKNGKLRNSSQQYVHGISKGVYLNYDHTNSILTIFQSPAATFHLSKS